MAEKKLPRFDTIERDLYFDLTLDEVRQKGEELAQLHREINEEIDQAKEAAKNAKGKIKLLEIKRNGLADIVRQRRELRMGLVDLLDLGGGRVREIRQDTGEVLTERLMTDTEKQRVLPTIGKKMASNAQAGEATAST